MKRYLVLFGLLVLGAGLIFAAEPLWWSQPPTQIHVPGAAADNYAPANLGQLKHVATQAKKYLDLQCAVVGGAGPAVNALVAAFEPRSGQNYTAEQVAAFRAANYAPINLGQLKAVAKPFYDRLLTLGYDTRWNLLDHGYPATWAFNYPWNPATPVAENYAPANLGQLKMVFSFDLEKDTDGDNLPDWWEVAWGLNKFDPADAIARLDGRGRKAIDYFLEGQAPSVDGAPDPARWDRRPRLNLYQVDFPDGSYDLSWDGAASISQAIDLERQRPDGTWEVVATVSGALGYYHVTSSQP